MPIGEGTAVTPVGSNPMEFVAAPEDHSLKGLHLSRGETQALQETATLAALEQGAGRRLSEHVVESPAHVGKKHG